MKIQQMYSHLNGFEHIKFHKPKLWKEIETVIQTVNANKCRTKVSGEIRKHGKTLFSPIDMNVCFKKELEKHGSSYRKGSIMSERNVHEKEYQGFLHAAQGLAIKAKKCDLLESQIKQKESELVSLRDGHGRLHRKITEMEEKIENLQKRNNELLDRLKMQQAVETT